MAINNLRLSFIFFLLAFAYEVNKTAAGGCSGSARLGDCGPPGECNKRCQWSYPGSEGSCDYTLPNPPCTCYYRCSPPAPPQCTTYNGLCGLAGCPAGDCCTERCKVKYPGPGTSGMCDQLAFGYRVCFCVYNC